jgi:hypothetical protein
MFNPVRAAPRNANHKDPEDLEESVIQAVSEFELGGIRSCAPRMDPRFARARPGPGVEGKRIDYDGQVAGPGMARFPSTPGPGRWSEAVHAWSTGTYPAGIVLLGGLRGSINNPRHNKGRFAF